MLPKNESGPCIRIEGARQHNLKNVSVDIPRDKLVCSMRCWPPT